MSQNFIFIILGWVASAMGVLGFIIYNQNRKGATNFAYLLLSLSTILWGIFNFLYNQPHLNNLALIFLRIHMFFAIWYAFSIFNLYYAFPNISFNYSKTFKYVLLPLTIFVSILTLTPLVFEKIISFKPDGTIGSVKTNIGIVLFGITTIGLLISFFVGFIKKIYSVKETNLKYSAILIFIGALVTFTLHIIFNFIFPNVFGNAKYIQFGILYSIPLILLTFLAIVRYQFLNIKFILIDILISILLILTAFQILISINFIEILIRIIIFIFILIVSLITIQSVRKEVELREKLEKLNRIKSEFLSFASHQVKAPMAVVKGYAELIADGIENVPEQAKDFAKKIKDSVDKLLVLIEQFMDYRRIEEGKMDLNFEEVEIISLIKEILNNFTILAKEKNLELSLETNLEQIILKVDKLRFSQVIQNLIDNAIKYTPQGWVKVSVYKQNNELIICVSDSGIGMSKELQSKLFGEFVRDPSIKKEIRGTGLGLYIVKNLVEAHQGRIWAESEGEGRGSKFFVSLLIRDN
ncbi:MAG: hypothetical protein KatS3mg094_084 [Candidatus Parcubacteria bacterium]|nr:MAG: hypothetical protein KatS3mg094_084 [Candidatus Parcubacteria bacterium]